MKLALQCPAVRFTGVQARAVGRGFGDIIARLQLVVYAAAIMPDHVHIVVARQEMYAETIAGYLKRAASRKLRAEGLHPFSAEPDEDGKVPTPWGEGGWKVFLHSLDEIEGAMQYVNQNPIEAGLPPQRWRWITEVEP
jgi:REP element-mobilizing transposase RayT